MTKEQITAFHNGKMEASIDASGDKSTGLGLLLCKEFSDKIDMDITIESNQWKGTTFILKT